MARMWLVILLFLSACNAAISAPTPIVTPAPELPTLTPTATSLPTPSPTPTLRPVTAEIVSFDTEDNVTLSGTLYTGEGDLAVILVHMGITTQTGWQAFAEYAAGRGLTALTFDSRGYGLSGGSQSTDYDDLAEDVLAAAAFLKGRGYRRLACFGASQGGAACQRAALRTDLVGLGIIASPVGLKVTDWPALTLPKLFVVAENDPYVGIITTEAMYKLAPEPKQIKVFPQSTLHGTEMFSSYVFRDEFRDLLISFLEGLKSP